jgi:hypothetical protein
MAFAELALGGARRRSRATGPDEGHRREHRDEPEAPNEAARDERNAEAEDGQRKRETERRTAATTAHADEAQQENRAHATDKLADEHDGDKNTERHLPNAARSDAERTGERPALFFEFLSSPFPVKEIQKIEMVSALAVVAWNWRNTSAARRSRLD